MIERKRCFEALALSNIRSGTVGPLATNGVGHMSDAKLMDKSKAEPVRRLEVFTGAGQRRRWTASEKAQMVAETFADGASVSAVARRYALRPQQLFAWRRQALRGASRGASRNGRSGK